MDYFILTQDKRYRRVPTLHGLNQPVMHRDLKPGSAYKIADVGVYFSNSEYPQDYIDIMDHQLFMVSRDMKKVFQMYDPSMRFKLFCVLNRKTNEMGEYYAPIFREIDCVSENSQFNLDKSFIKHLVLHRSMIGEQSIFRVSGLRKETVIIRLDVAESLLRRKLRGISLNRVGLEV